MPNGSNTTVRKGLNHEIYMPLLTTQDEKIGELVILLEENNLREDTIIIFQSDNGHSTGAELITVEVIPVHTEVRSSVCLKGN